MSASSLAFLCLTACSSGSEASPGSSGGANEDAGTVSGGDASSSSSDAAADDADNGDPPADDAAPPDAAGLDVFVPSACSGAAPKFVADVAPILKTSCALGTCHKSFGASGTAYTWLLKTAPECSDGRQIVKPKDPANSYIIQKLTDHDLCSGVPMPKASPWKQLDQKKIQTIYDWICVGAANN